MIEPQSATHPWWKGATVYQVYPRSFADSNDDGIGGLPGITARLDYIASLGVDAVWLSPFFTSPMKDFGYDVADYCGVDPIFGTLADFDALVAYARMAMLLFVSLRDNIIVWQGEELGLGLTQVHIPFERLQDPEAIANWPLTLSRDGTRTPMVWSDNAPNGGFNHGQPWLPIGDDHGPLAVARQDGDPASMLEVTRQMIALRKASPALRWGDIRFVAADEDILIFMRHTEEQTALCAFNLGASAIDWTPPAGSWTLRDAVRGATLALLPPYSGMIAYE